MTKKRKRPDEDDKGPTLKSLKRVKTFVTNVTNVNKRKLGSPLNNKTTDRNKKRRLSVKVKKSQKLLHDKPLKKKKKQRTRKSNFLNLMT